MSGERDLREALRRLVDACLLADANEELSGYVDGSLLDAARAALAAPEPARPLESLSQSEALRQFMNECLRLRSVLEYIAFGPASEPYEAPADIAAHFRDKARAALAASGGDTK